MPGIFNLQEVGRANFGTQ